MFGTARYILSAFLLALPSSGLLLADEERSTEKEQTAVTAADWAVFTSRAKRSALGPLMEFERRSNHLTDKDLQTRCRKLRWALYRATTDESFRKYWLKIHYAILPKDADRSDKRLGEEYEARNRLVTGELSPDDFDGRYAELTKAWTAEDGTPLQKYKSLRDYYHKAVQMSEIARKQREARPDFSELRITETDGIGNFPTVAALLPLFEMLRSMAELSSALDKALPEETREGLRR